jgi:hypothetical protein
VLETKFRTHMKTIGRVISSGAFAKLRKATVRLVMPVRLSVCPPVRPHGTSWLPLDEFSWKLMCTVRKCVQKIEVSLKSDNNDGYFTWRHFRSYLAQFFLAWELFQAIVQEETKTHIVCSTYIFPFEYTRNAVYDIMWKNIGRRWQYV